MSSTDQGLAWLVGRGLAKWANTITDGETGKRGVVIRPSNDGAVTIMEDFETGKQAVVIWLDDPSN